MGKGSDYYRQLSTLQKRKILTIKKRLPKYVGSFIHECDLQYQPNTVIAYANDLLVFFTFLKEENPLYSDMAVKDIPLEALKQITFEDVNDYQSYLSYSFGEGEQEHNIDKPGIVRKMASLRRFFNYMTSHGYLDNDPTLKAAKMKRKENDIIRMDSYEVGCLKKAVQTTDLPTKRARSISSKTNLRDIAIITLLLRTGIRVSECVGLDLDDVDFNNNTINIVRKGGKTALIYFEEEVRNTLKDYILHERNSLIQDDSERALFVSMSHTRLSARSIERMVKKYASNSVQGKKITPHKLRSTFGTALYRSSKDIYLVAAVLGHKDVNTTVKHYAAIDEDQKRKAASYDIYNDYEGSDQ